MHRIHAEVAWDRARGVACQGLPLAARQLMATALRKKLEVVRAEVYEVYTKADQATLMRRWRRPENNSQMAVNANGTGALARSGSATPTA